MKIRIKGNSIRLRLSKPEVDQFGKEGYLEERTEFTDNALIYALQTGGQSEELSAGFSVNKITVYMPANYAQMWVSTNEVGYSNMQGIGTDKELFLLVEKDFKCIDPTGLEDQSDNYENPSHNC